jgi:hypothetical protein
MKVRALSSAAALLVGGVVACGVTACNPATKSKAATTPAAVPPATATAADEASPSNSAASPSVAASQSAATSAPAITSASSAASSSAPAPAAGGGGSVNVCSLMTSAQASSINGVTYGAATPQHFETGLDTCDYKNNGSPDPIDIQDLTITVMSLPGCYSQLESADGPGTKVTGVGDDAFGDEIGMDVKVGNRCVEVSGLTSAEFKDNYAPDVAMAKIIIAGLH